MLRSILTTGSMIVGVVAVVTMGWAIKGLDAIWEQTISIIGKDMMYVDKWDWAGGGNWRKTEARKDLSLEQVESLRYRMESPEYVIPLARKWGGSVSYGNKVLRTAVMGTAATYGMTPAGITEDGRFFTPIEEQQAANVIVIGHGIKKALFPTETAVGKNLKIQGIPFRVIGVVEKRGVLFMDFVDNQVYIPLYAFRSAYGFNNRSFSVAIKAGNERMMNIVREEAIGVMRGIRNVPPHKENDFSINEMKAFDDEVKKIRFWIWAAGLGLTVLAFIVGSINLTNIMFVSVSERTKEIGVRKAIGAKRGSIRLQFLMESTLLCVTAAVLALPVSQFVTWILHIVAGSMLPADVLAVVSALIPVDLLMLAIAIATVVGLMAGLIPAIRASNLDPVEALRAE
ncbi:MAG: ABC transporter permease [bacterium]|nr:ABC transporter permease [bacterium]